MSSINFETIDLKSLKIPEFAAMTGRVKKFLADPERGLMPASCTTYEFDHDRRLQSCTSEYEFQNVYIQELAKMMEFVAKSLKGASGVKIQLGQWRPFPSLDVDANWKFYLSPDHPDFNKVTGYHKEYFDIHQGIKADHVVIEVADSLAEVEDFRMSIIGSWKHFMEVLLEGNTTPLINLSLLRPYGSVNGKGLFASGALGSGDPNFPDNGSFYSVYKYLFAHLISGDLTSLLQLMGQLNETMLRGGFTKSSITCTAMDWRSPYFLQYLLIPVATLSGSQKQSARLTPEILQKGNETLLALIAEKMTKESMFLEIARADDLFSNVCVEIIQKHRSTCLLVHVNGGAIKEIKDISKAIVEVTEFTAKIWATWRRYVGKLADIYIDVTEDRQIGVGWIGFANMLAHFGVKYVDFIHTLDVYLNGSLPLPEGENLDETSCKIVEELMMGYSTASLIADIYGLERVFTLAPTQRCYQDYLDQSGRMTTRSINPPYQKRVRRSSESEGQKWGYHGNVETMAEVGANSIEKLWDLWQQMIDYTGKAHTLSYDAHYDITPDKLKWLISDESHLNTVYYNMAKDLDQSYLNKGAITKIQCEEKAVCTVCAE